MAEQSTLARPYANAVFELAKQDNSLATWSDTLSSLKAVVCHDELAGLIKNPSLRRAQLVELICAAGGGVTDKGANLVQLLAENGKLSLLPEIAAQFEALRGEEEGVVDVLVSSAQALSDTQQAAIETSLKQRLKRDVRINCTLDPALIGGAVIRAGDLVIDGSVRAKLERLAVAMAA